jgi:carboxypeptidase PM20D1
MGVRRTVFVLALGLLALSFVLLGRAMTMSSRQEALGLGPAIHVDAAAAADSLSKAIQFRTISYQNASRVDPSAFLGLHGYLAQTFVETHRRLRRDVIERFSLLYTWPGSDTTLPPVLLLGHLDVVPVDAQTEAEWTYPPFSGMVADGYIWGRGAMDDKIAVMGTMEAVEGLLRSGFTPRRTIMLAFGHDEEVTGPQGARRIAARLAERGLRVEMVLDEGMAILEGIIPGMAKPVASVGIAEKGYASLELIADGQGGHSSMPPGQTSVGVLAGAIRALEAHPMPAHLDGPVESLFRFLAPEMPLGPRIVMANVWLFKVPLTLMLSDSPPTRALIRTTLAPTILEGSVKENVLAARARAVVNVRIHPADDLDDVVEHVNGIIRDGRVTVRVLDDKAEPSDLSPVDAPAFRLLHRAIREQFPDVVLAPGLVLGATDSRHYRSLTDNIYRFLPIRIGPPDVARIHGVDERLSVEQYAHAIAFYTRLIRHMSE